MPTHTPNCTNHSQYVHGDIWMSDEPLSLTTLLLAHIPIIKIPYSNQFLSHKTTNTDTLYDENKISTPLININHHPTPISSIQLTPHQGQHHQLPSRIHLHQLRTPITHTNTRPFQWPSHDPLRPRSRLQYLSNILSHKVNLIDEPQGIPLHIHESTRIPYLPHNIEGMSTNLHAPQQLQRSDVGYQWTTCLHWTLIKGHSHDHELPTFSTHPRHTA